MEIFEYIFMRKAFLAGIIVAIIIPCIGVIIVLKRLSMIGDALSHTSLAGVAAGLILNINPVIGAMIVCVAAALSIESIRKRLPRYSEMSIAIIMSLGIGLAGILSDYVKTPASFDSFLFGSIIAITDLELYLIVGLGALVLTVFILLYKELFYIAFDTQGARLSGVKVQVVNTIFTILTAIAISLAAKIVGALLVSSLIVLPVACSMQISKSYLQTIIYAIIFAVASTIIGLFLSFYQGFKPGSIIALIGVFSFLAVLLIKTIYKKAKKLKTKNQ
ncbi:MAG TPA: metal ABC transporter permease [Clostridiales bacterium]|nr:metal ABC transporter permease [Clostridiales bacterium]